MLTALSIRDIVLIEKLDLGLDHGMTVLTGETGAGKSILLDALGLALGGRGDSGLVRNGADRGVVTAAFHVDKDHAAIAMLKQLDLDVEDGEIIIRRIQSPDGKSRAFINDQPASIAILKKLGALLAEIHGQHDDRALVDVAEHRRLVDAYGGLNQQAEAVASLWQIMSDARKACENHDRNLAKIEAEREFIEHAVAELREINPQPGEESQLADARQLMMNAEKFADAINTAQSSLTGGDKSFEANLNSALRMLERRRDQSNGLLDEACSALERLAAEFTETQSALDIAAKNFAFDQTQLEQTEERLFSLRALARKHNVEVDDLSRLLEEFEDSLQNITDGAQKSQQLRQAATEAEATYLAAAQQLSDQRRIAAQKFDQALHDELRPLRLEKARFETLIDSDSDTYNKHGIDRVEFQIAANPGTPLAPLNKAASGGELSRIMLALKVVLAASGSAPTLIFDEIDTGVGGAVADAIGQRLARLANDMQVMTVTHSPQVASRASAHMLITKLNEAGGEDQRTITRITPLTGQTRREEIARMLSGAAVTEEARAQADRLIAGTG